MNDRQNQLEEKRREEKRYVGIKQATARGYAVMEVGGVADFLYPTSKLRRGRVQGGGQISPTITSENTGVCKVEMNDIKAIDEQNMNVRSETFGTLTTDGSSPKHNNRVLENIDWENCEYRIRKLTPRSCGRLMDVADEDIDKMLSVNSNTQAYKQFGNSIVCSVLCAIFSQLNIKGVKTWNERTLKEKYDLVANPAAHIN